ncbi:MAG: hypothetical protein ICV79_25955, partial [Flavisolibacter sp.]|nr:hypothetical protein [Flavisolibacter sp.]
TIASIALHVVFGILTFSEAPNIATNGPTPMIGIWERINIGIFMVWVIVLAIVLLQSINDRGEKTVRRGRVTVVNMGNEEKEWQEQMQ